jgi:nucleoside-diphosphate-sugar epimerase
LAAIETVLHSAAIVAHHRPADPRLAEVNVAGTLQVIRAARALGNRPEGARVVFISSSGTVGCYRHNDLRADEHAPFADAVVGRWPYYASKIQAERESRKLAEKLGVPYSIVRLPVLLGPDDHRRRSTEHVARVLEGRVPFVPDGGMHFTDVRDVAAALARLAVKPQWQATYHFPGHQSSLAAFFTQVAEVGNLKFERPPVPTWLLRGVAGATESLAKTPKFQRPRWLPDPVVLEMAACHWGLTTLWTHAELDYRPRPARQTIADTVHWLRQQPPVPKSERHAA